MSIQNGKVTDLTKDYRGWLIGDFVKADSPFKSDSFEVKYVVRKKGDYKESARSHDKPIKTLGILVEGKMKVELIESQKEISLTEKGDYIFYEPFEFHKFTAIEDSQMIVIRWSE